MPADRDEVIAKLRAWLLQRRPTLSPDALDADTDIVQTRILASLQLVEFLLYVERLCGRTVLVEGLDPRELRTLSTIHTRYWGAPRGE
jgi:hypothetical protein